METYRKLDKYSLIADRLYIYISNDETGEESAPMGKTFGLLREFITESDDEFLKFCESVFKHN